jgi:four helix bundle protein
VVRDVGDLVVYQRAVALADAVYAAGAAWDSFDRWTVGVQVMRAADSIGANLSEAWGRDTRADRRRIVFLARGSACELEHWIARAAERGLALPPDASADAAEVSRILNGLLRAWS